MTGVNALLDAVRRRLRGALEAPRPAPPPMTPGVTISSGSLGGRRGRGYRLYVPARLSGPKAPLIVMLHGCKQTPESFAQGTRMNTVADERGFLVLYPAQTRLANPAGCWNWFLPRNQARGGEPAAIVGMIDDVTKRWPVDPGRVFVAGLSAGAATALTLGSACPERFAAVGAHSGLSPEGVRTAHQALAAMRDAGSGRPSAPPRPTMIIHGDADKTVTVEHVERLNAAMRALRPRLREKIEQTQGWTRRRFLDAQGAIRLEALIVHGLGHAWSGGDGSADYASAEGPDASRRLARFFLDDVTGASRPAPLADAGSGRTALR